MRKNIAYITFGLRNFSGAAFQSLKLANYIKDKYNVIYFDFTEDDTKCISRKYSHLVFTMPKSVIKRIFFIQYIARRKNISLFHLHGFAPSIFLIRLFSRTPIIVKTTSLGGDDFATLCKGVVGILKRVLIKLIDTNIAISKGIVKTNMKYINPAKVLHIPNAVRFEKNNQVKSMNFCIVGVLQPGKRTYEAIKYYIDNYSHLPDAKLFIAGPIDDQRNKEKEEREYIKKCIDLVTDTGNQNNIKFLGFLSHEQVMQLFNNCLAMFLFSIREGMPNVVLEAMANNCVPIVTPMNGVAREIIDNCKDGFIIEDLNCKVDINLISNIWQSKSTVDKIKKYFSEEIVYEKYLQLYSDLIKSH
jgi:glycosyltransferase involved in cell wall biosynthesis